MPKCFGEVILVWISFSATAIKSSYALCLFSLSAAWCQLGPNSPPPRILAITYTPPESSQALENALK